MSPASSGIVALAAEERGDHVARLNATASCTCVRHCESERASVTQTGLVLPVCRWTRRLQIRVFS